MSLLELFFPIATVVLGAGCFVCYKTNKPLRKRAREEREAIAAKDLKDAQEAQAKLKRDELRIKVWSDMEQALSDPESSLRENRYLASGRGSQYRWKALADLAFFMKDHKRLNAVVGDQAARLDAQAKTIRELKGQVAEIHRLLKPYA